jgi:membrane associated rhomboid family serine protease
VVIDRRPGPVASFFFVGTWLAFMWLLEGVDALTGGALDSLGVSPRDVTELPQIFTAPFLHFGFAHLIANSVPFLVLGTLTRMAGRREFWIATLSSIVVSGLVTWLISAPMSVTAGASGLVFGWLGFLLLRGLFARNWVQILVAAAVFGFFGGMLWGVFPTMPGVSWQAHLGGVLGGALAAWWLHRRPRGAR